MSSAGQTFIFVFDRKKRNERERERKRKKHTHRRGPIGGGANPISRLFSAPPSPVDRRTKVPAPKIVGNDLSCKLIERRVDNAEGAPEDGDCIDLQWRYYGGSFDRLWYHPPPPLQCFFFFKNELCSWQCDHLRSKRSLRSLNRIDGGASALFFFFVILFFNCGRHWISSFISDVLSWSTLRVAPVGR